MYLKAASVLALALCARGQEAASQTPDANTPAPQAPAALPSPAVTGPLQAAPPIAIGGETIPWLYANGVVSGMGVWQGVPAASDESRRADLSNGQLWIQKTTGWWQFYVQAGAYNVPILGAPHLSTADTVSELFGPVAVAYLKLAPAKNTSIMVGSLPTLMGAESTFTFQNMNVNRGLLWNQENDVNRGVQVNQTVGKFTAALSWNDGYWSNRYSWLSGSLTYTNGAHSLFFQGMGNMSHTEFRRAATPVQNNGRMYAAGYTYSKGSWIAQPYFQWSQIDADGGGSTKGGAVLASHSFGRGWSLAGRAEYLGAAGLANLLYGPGSAAWSLTLTPTYQYGRFFARADLAVVRANDWTAGFAFGSAGDKRTQPRATIEAGFLF